MAELNVGAVVQRVVSTVTDFRFLNHAGGTWFAIVLAANATVYLLHPQTGELSSSGWVNLAIFVRVLIDSLAVAACAVNVHRMILLDEMPAPIRVSRLEWRYILRGFRVWWPLAAIVFVAIVIGNLNRWPFSFDTTFGQVMWTALITLILLPLFAPRSLSLPAIAVGRREFTPDQGSAAATGNRRAIYLCTIIAGAIPSLILRAMDQAFLTLTATLGLPAAYTVVTSAIGIFRALLWASLFSFLYAAMVEKRHELLG